ncbi:MAG: hypothetical protein KDD60_12805, partial [Bdellovibrionales bacterium]|nr:hypothetical protein [Bdellovibrionales bacterium]
MSIAVCLPICGESFEDSQKIIEAESQSFDYFELWLDYLNDCEVGKLQHLVTQYPDRILLLFRRKGLEPPLMKSERKKEIIEGLRKFPCIFDFDISVQRAD